MLSSFTALLLPDTARKNWRQREIQQIIGNRVVQAGALDVVVCILEAWLASTGIPHEPILPSPMPKSTFRYPDCLARGPVCSCTRNLSVNCSCSIGYPISTDI